MIGTIRKHSSWLWWLVAGLTIVSFVIFMGQGGSRNGGRAGSYGTIYGKLVTPEDFAAAEREFLIYYWQRYHEFPGHNPNFTKLDMEKETYVRLIFKAKAEQLGIHVSEEAQVQAANNFLRSLSSDGQPVELSRFADVVLTPQNLTIADFQRFITDDLITAQLILSLGLPGMLATPDEVNQMYDRDHQEFATEAVFFSASNYMSQVSATTAAVGTFYTNHMAAYRVPNRVQLNYVAFELTNFFAAAELKMGKTNIAAQAEAYYADKGLSAVPGAKTADEAKAKLRDAILRQAAGELAKAQARDFVNALFAMDPVSPDNLVTLARSKGLVALTTAPFTDSEGPREFPASTELVTTAFKLNADSPFSKPLVCQNGIYVIGLARQLPSAIVPLNEIQGRVVQDFKYFEGAALARTAGTNFAISAQIQTAMGKSFAQAAVAAHQVPVALTPFSLSSHEVPEAEGHVELNELKNTAFDTTPGRTSTFVETADGGFVLYVKNLLPVDQKTKAAELPQYVEQIRRTRATEMFNVWVNNEMNRELPNTPVWDEMKAAKSAAAQ